MLVTSLCSYAYVFWNDIVHNKIIGLLNATSR